MSAEQLSIGIAFVALVFSIYTLWTTNWKKGKPQFVCSRWTAFRMTTKENTPRAAFVVQIDIINKGAIPLEIKDFVLIAIEQSKKKYFYEPLILWDITQWIADGSRNDRVGRTQKGQIPLPAVIQPNQSYNFDYPILFLPIDTSEMVKPESNSSILLELYCLTDRTKKYEKIAIQEFSESEIKSLEMNAFSAVRTSNSIKLRPVLIEKMKK